MIQRFLRDIVFYKDTLILLFVPILLSPLLFLIGTPESKCAFVVGVMGAYWMFETFPLAVTGLLPVILFPILGVMSSPQVCVKYLQDTTFLFVGGLIVAVAVEKSNLHMRIALKVLTIVGSQPRWIMAGFMSVSAFLSMWISNTATTAMMIPIGQTVVIQLVKCSKPQGQDDAEIDLMDGRVTAENFPLEERQDQINVGHQTTIRDDQIDVEQLTSHQKGMAKGLLICICYAASIGGTATLTGTPPNLVLVQNLADVKITGVTFASWMAFATPSMLISLIVCWLCLVLHFLGWRELISEKKVAKRVDEGVGKIFMDKYHNLPPISFAEVEVTICFAILLILWIFREPQFIPGIGDFFKPKHFTDATCAMMVSVLMFALPDKCPNFLCTPSQNRNISSQRRGTLLDWDTIHKKFPWNVMLLLGGGFALAHGVEVSKLSTWVVMQMNMLRSTTPAVIQFVCVILTMMVTAVTSNTATASIFLPIIYGLANSLGTHPLALMCPVTLACSYAFALPVSTPPNAIAFASGWLKVGDMMKAGLLVSCASVLVIVLNVNIYAHLVFDLTTVDLFVNVTSSLNSTMV